MGPGVWIDLPCPCELQRALRKTGLVQLLTFHGAGRMWQVSMGGMAINDKMFGLLEENTLYSLVLFAVSLAGCLSISADSAGVVVV